MARGSRSIEYLYDFLYYDAPRVASYFAQLHPDGALVGIKRAVEATSGTGSDAEINAAVLKAKLGGTTRDSETVERQFDPAWVLPITMLDRLDELGFIKRDAKEARIGDLLLVSGELALLDIRMLRELWEPIIRAETNKKPQGNRQQRRAAERTKSTEDENEESIRLAMQALKHLPHAIQMHLLAETDTIWGTLLPERMIMSPDDLALKHGAKVPGKWHVLGIVDALASDQDQTLPSVEQFLGMTEIAQAMVQALLQIRIHFGRPFNSFGLLPILVFRTVNAPS